MLDLLTVFPVVLPSPNGGTVAAALADAGPVVLAGCLRNASAVEDLLGAGAVLHALAGRPSPEARAAVAAFRQHDLPGDLLDCASGRELAALGRVAEVRLAAQHDVSQVVPVLRDGAFTAA
jgi:2-phosphosulfolactate phosphatase